MAPGGVRPLRVTSATDYALRTTSRSTRWSTTCLLEERLEGRRCFQRIYQIKKTTVCTKVVPQFAVPRSPLQGRNPPGPSLTHHRRGDRQTQASAFCLSVNLKLHRHHTDRARFRGSDCTPRAGLLRARYALADHAGGVASAIGTSSRLGIRRLRATDSQIRLPNTTRTEAMHGSGRIAGAN